MRKITILLFSIVAFIFGDTELLKDAGEVVEIHESHIPLNQDEISDLEA